MEISGKNEDNDQQRLKAEFYLLNEFHYHISEQRLPKKHTVSIDDISDLHTAIIDKLKIGTELKVKDLHEQSYQRLTEKIEEGSLLTDKQATLLKFLKEQPDIQHLVHNQTESVSNHVTASKKSL